MRLSRLLLVMMTLGALCACGGTEELKPEPMPVTPLVYGEITVNGTALSGILATTYADRSRAEAAVGLAEGEGEVACLVYGIKGEEEPLNLSVDLRRAGDLVYINAAGKVVKVYDGDNGYLPPSVRNQSTQWSAVPQNFPSIEPASIGLFLQKGLAEKLKLTEGSTASFGGDVLAKIKDADPDGVKLYFQPAKLQHPDREAKPDPVKLQARVAGTPAQRAEGLRQGEDTLLLVWPDNDTSLAENGFWLKGIEGKISLAFLRIQPTSGWSTGEAHPFMGFIMDIIEGIEDSGSDDLTRARWWPSEERLERSVEGMSRGSVSGPVNAVLLVRGESALSGLGISSDFFVQGTSYPLPQNPRTQDTPQELAGTVLKIAGQSYLPKVVRADVSRNSRIVVPHVSTLASNTAALLVWDTPKDAHLQNSDPRKSSIALLQQDAGNAFTVASIVELSGGQTQSQDLPSRYALVVDANLAVGAKVTLPWEAIGLIPTLRKAGFYAADRAPKKRPNSLPANGKEVYLEVADNDQTIELGLMHRTALRENHGMIFMFKESKKHSFWMKNCLMDIDVAFVDKDGAIRVIQEMKQPEPGTTDVDLKLYPSSSSDYAKGEAIYAVEMAGGWFAKNGIKVGDRLWLPIGQSKPADK